MVNNALINLLVREEQRYLCKHPKEFLRLLLPLVKRKKFSSREVVENIYLDSDDHCVPFGVSIRVRRYLARRNRTPVLHRANAFLEYKKTVGMNKAKHRQTIPLHGAVALANRKDWGLGSALRPFFAVQYLRHHFLPKQGKGMRITVDWNIRYYYFPLGSRKGIPIGNENNYARIEIKKRISLPDIERQIQHALLATHSIPVISKRILAQRFLHQQLYRLDPHPRWSEMPRKEFQVKFEMQRPDERFFPKLVRVFGVPHGSFHRARLSPMLTESASIRRYHLVGNALELVIFQGSAIKLVKRLRSRTLRVPSTVGAIPIQQCEVKTRRLTPAQCYRVLSHPLAAELDRKKKCFWVENIRTHRVYSICFDRSQHNKRYLYQVEIQFAGTRSKPSPRPQRAIITDLVQLATIIQRAFPALHFTTRTKSQWAGLDE